MIRCILLVFIFVGSFSLSAKKSDDWYDIAAIDFQEAISDFPRQGSAAYIEDYQILLDDQARRSEEECQFGRYLKWPEFKIFFAKNKPDSLDDSRLPVKFDQLLTEVEVKKYKKLMNKVLKFSSKVTKYYKEKYQRDRPSRVNADIHPCADVPEGAKSYPSSHAAKGALLGCLFSQKFKSQGDIRRAQAFLSYGQYMGDIRTIIGVHHPSDVEAGQSIAYAICDRLLTDAKFLKLFNEL